MQEELTFIQILCQGQLIDLIVLLFLAKVLIQLENLHEVLQGNLILSYATQNISKETS